MMGDKNNESESESESDIPADITGIVTASTCARARKRNQQLIMGSQGRLGKMDNDGDKNSEGEATYQQFED